MAKSWPAARAVENTNPLACTLQAGHSDVAFAVAVVHLIRMLVHALKLSFGFLSFFFLSPISSSNARLIGGGNLTAPLWLLTTVNLMSISM